MELYDRKYKNLDRLLHEDCEHRIEIGQREYYCTGTYKSCCQHYDDKEPFFSQMDSIYWARCRYKKC